MPRFTTRPLSPLALVVALVANSARAQTTLFDVSGQTSSAFGRSVASAGDVNRDGVPDLIVGASSDSTALLYSGADGQWIRTHDGSTPGTQMGWSVDGVGDLDNDGHDDVIVGEIAASHVAASGGAATVFSGRTGAQIYRFDGRFANDRLGSSVAGIGDIDLDSVPDLLVGAVEYTTGEGYVRVISGATGTTLMVLDGENMDDAFGRWVAGGEQDFDGDSVPDFVIGASDYGVSREGAVYVYSGAAQTLIRKHVGASPTGALGAVVDVLDDVDGDGVDDYLAAAFEGMNPSGVKTGKVVLYSGKTGQELRTFYGTQLFEVFGRSVAALGDMNGDGVQDIAIGSRTDHNGGVDAGACFVYSADGRLLYTMQEDGAGEFMGEAAAAAGDLNGDGLDDLFVAVFSDDTGEGIAGRVDAMSGSTFVLDVQPQIAINGDKVVVNLLGTANQLYLLYVFEVNGAPFTQQLLKGKLNGSGEVQVPTILGPGFAGLDIGLFSLSQDFFGQVVASNEELVRLR